MKSWFKTWWPARKQAQTPEEAELLLMDRGTAEIAARLLRRAELHDKGNHYLRACAALDRVAAENIRRLELKAGTDMGVWQDRRYRCLCLLREGNK